MRLAALLLLLNACGPSWEPSGRPDPELDPWSGLPLVTTDPDLRARQIWTTVHGYLWGECADMLAASTITAAPYREVGTLCERDHVAGCVVASDHEGADIVVDEAQDGPDLRTHELLHVLHKCMYWPDADAGHTDGVWRYLPVAW